MGMLDTFGESGPDRELLKKYELTAEAAVALVLDEL